MNRVRRALAALALLAATACAGGPSLENRGEVTAPPGDSRDLTVGSAGFTESDLLAQLYALLLEHAGYSTDLISVTNREIYEPAWRTARSTSYRSTRRPSPTGWAPRPTGPTRNPSDRPTSPPR